MPRADKYAAYRVKPKGREQIELDVAGNDSERRKTLHIRFAIEAARTQLEGGKAPLVNAWSPDLHRETAAALPEEEDACERFPGVDPRGRYSSLDMNVAHREQQILTTLQMRSPEAGKLVRDIMKSEEYRKRLHALEGVAREQRFLLRAAKLCADPAGEEELSMRARALCLHPDVVAMKQMTDGLEWLVGMRKGASADHIERFFRDELKTPITTRQVLQCAEFGHPTEPVVTFPDFHHQAMQMRFAKPENWGKTPDDFSELSEEELAEQTARYIRGTTGQTLDRFFDSAERMNRDGNSLDRSDHLIIGGGTAREILAERFNEGGVKGYDTFEKFYDEKGHEAVAELVTNALQTGERVEAYVPDAQGRINMETPVELKQVGFEHDKLEPVEFSVWERFWKRFGFYKEKTARADEYEKWAMARERVAVYNKSAQMRFSEGVNEKSKDEFFREWKEKHHTDRLPQRTPLGHSVSRSMWTTFAIMQMVNDGKPLSEVLDPTKLYAEKQAAGERVIARFAVETDPAAEVDFFRDGAYKLSRAIDELAKGLPLRGDPKGYTSEAMIPLIRAGMAGFDASQDISKIKGAFIEKYGEDDYWKTMEKLDGLSLLVSSLNSMDKARKAILTGQPTGSNIGNDIADYLTGAVMIHAVQERLKKKPDTPLSEVLDTKFMDSLHSVKTQVMGEDRNWRRLAEQYESSPKGRELLRKAVLSDDLLTSGVFRLGKDMTVDIQLPEELFAPLPEEPAKAVKTPKLARQTPSSPKQGLQPEPPALPPLAL